MSRRLAAFWRRTRQPGKIEHFVEIGIELVPGQAYWASFSLTNLLGLMPQMVAAAASKRSRMATCRRTSSANPAGHVEGLGLTLGDDGNLILHMQVGAIGAVTGRPSMWHRPSRET
jgi:hypothetical protein